MLQMENLNTFRLTSKFYNAMVDYTIFFIVSNSSNQLFLALVQ
jgi:hypothetical protein